MGSDEPPPPERPACWIEGAVSRVRPYIELIWPLRDGPHYRELSIVAVLGDALLDPRTLHVELLSPPALAVHHLAQAHAQVRADLDSYIWEVGAQDLDPWPEAMHRCRSSGQWYSALPWCLIDPGRAAQGGIVDRSSLDASAPPIPTHCPHCATPTVHDDRKRVFRCPACAWHD